MVNLHICPTRSRFANLPNAQYSVDGLGETSHFRALVIRRRTVRISRVSGLNRVTMVMDRVRRVRVQARASVNVLGNCDRSVRHYFWLFFSVLTTETDIWEV